MTKPSEVCFVHLMMQKQSDNGVTGKEAKVVKEGKAANQEKACYKEVD